jgi:hypothetical protein
METEQDDRKVQSGGRRCDVSSVLQEIDQEMKWSRYCTAHADLRRGNSELYGMSPLDLMLQALPELDCARVEGALEDLIIRHIRKLSWNVQKDIELFMLQETMLTAAWRSVDQEEKRQHSTTSKAYRDARYYHTTILPAVLALLSPTPLWSLLPEEKDGLLKDRKEGTVCFGSICLAVFRYVVQHQLLDFEANNLDTTAIRLNDPMSTIFRESVTIYTLGEQLLIAAGVWTA